MNRFLLLITIGVLCACSPKVKTNFVKTYPALNYQEEVIVLGVQQDEPEGAEFLGEIRIGDSGLTTECDYGTIMEKAKLEARKIGGNVVKITQHKLPSAMSSTCHRIKAKILKVFDAVQLSGNQQEEILDVDYAILNVYRYGGAGSLVGYDLYLGDSVICRVKNNFKTTLHIKKDGLNTLWAQTEAKSEVPVNLKPRRQYYLRCGLTIGAFVGRPSLELVDYKTGKVEFESFNAKNQ